MREFPYNIARKAIADFAAYSARGGASGALHLDANESPYAPPPVKGAEGYNRYPEQQPPALIRRLADIYGARPECIMAGRGADEAIELLLRSFCEDGKDNILICSPTFGYYITCAQIQGAGIIDVPLNHEYQWDSAAILKQAKAAKNLKLIFLCSPNNPTGTIIEDDLVEQLCKSLPNTLVIVDEAYEEFCSAPSYIPKIGEFPNLVVLRTLSKAYALAGVRMGAAVADTRIIDILLKVLPPYPIARPVVDAVLAALSPAAMSTHAARLKETLSERERMSTALQKSPFIRKVWPSEANFLLIDIKEDEILLAELTRRNVKIRDYRNTTGHMRISIGSPEENSTALSAFGIETPPKPKDRIAETHRTTRETDISVRVNLDDAAQIQVNTGIGFYDHMLEALAKHGGFGLVLTCKGDLEIDAHHTVEDCALALGAALKTALGDKAGIGRFGFVMPMDETQARVAIDLSGRPAMRFRGNFPTDHVGEFPAEMCPHVFESLAQSLGAAIQIDVEGENTHHMIEASFKGVARALRPAFARSGTEIASTKGVI